MSDVVDIDPALRALDALADDYADPGAETAACPSMWPLLAVPTDALSPLDRDARDRHLARCARCRVALADAWLDAGGDALAPSAAPLPEATALPSLPDRRRAWSRALAGVAVAAAAAASLFAIVTPMIRAHDEPDPQVTPIAGARPAAPSAPAAPLELVIVVEDSARTALAIDALDAGLARVRARVPADARIMVTTVHGDALHVVTHDPGPTDLLAVPVAQGDASPPIYEAVLDDVDDLFLDRADRRAVVVIGGACGTWSAVQSADVLRAKGIAIAAVDLASRPSCGFAITRSRFPARTPAAIAPALDDAVDAAVRAAGSPPDVEHRAPLDLLVLIDGQAAFLGDGPTPYQDVRVALDELDPHVPEHSVMRFASVVGDTVTPLGHGDYPYIPLARSVLGEPRAYADKAAPPRYAIALERARHLLDLRHDRARALLVIGTGCELAPAERDARAKELAALRADGIAVSIVTYRPDALASCAAAFDGAAPPDVAIRQATRASALPGLIADAVEDFSSPAPGPELLHFVHHTLSAP